MRTQPLQEDEPPFRQAVDVLGLHGLNSNQWTGPFEYVADSEHEAHVKEDALNNFIGEFEDGLLEGEVDIVDGMEPRKLYQQNPQLLVVQIHLAPILVGGVPFSYGFEEAASALSKKKPDLFDSPVLRLSDLALLGSQVLV